MILVLNTGSSSLKWAVFDDDLAEVLSGSISGIGGEGSEKIGTERHRVTTLTHADAVARVLTALPRKGVHLDRISGAAHRIVHGGTELTAPVRITDAVRRSLQELRGLAPLHLPPALAAIDALRQAAPEMAQAASFDTAFHAGQDPIQTTYALGQKWRDKGIRRYGFHGLSYASLCATMGATLPRRTLAMHLGAGVSLCAILDGRSVATTMGFSPLSGPPMATRTGDLDPLAVLALVRECGVDDTAELLARQSGLLGLSGLSGDMMTLESSDDPAAGFAIAHFCHWIARAAGSLLPVLGGIDGIVFTGGIGENSAPVRDRIMADLRCLGPVPVHIVPAQEERQIASECGPLLASR